MALDPLKSALDPGPMQLKSSVFKQVANLKDLSFLPDKISSFSQKFLNLMSSHQNSKTFQQKIKKTAPWLSKDQVEEIKKIFFKIRDEKTVNQVFKFKKGALIEKDKRASFSYLLREQDFIVYTGLTAGAGHSKTVDEVLMIDTQGNVQLASHIKLNHEKRITKYFYLVQYEYDVRKAIDSEYVLKAGNIYVYESKSGIKKFSWITPYYNRNAASVIKARRGIGEEIMKEQDALPLNSLILSLKMAFSLKAMHEKGWIHRDIKLENYLVNFDPKKCEIQEVVLADTAFALEERRLESVKADGTKKAFSLHFKDIDLSLNEIIKMNPLFKSLTKKNSLPSVEEYLKIHQIVEKKDPHFDQLVAFLKGVDGYLVVGTPNHIAPEIFETRIFSRASDIYSLGYSMIRLKEQMELHSFYYHTVEIGFDELVNQMTHQDPSKRPSLEKVMARLLQLISIQKSSS